MMIKVFIYSALTNTNILLGYTELWQPSISNTADSYNISTMSNVGVPGVYRFALNATSFINPPPPLPPPSI